MLVKAKWNVKDASGWHDAGDVFRTENDLGDAVEVLDAPKQPEAKPDGKPAEPAEKQEEKPAVKRSTRRKTT